MNSNSPAKRKRPTAPCQYGKNCYRKNPHHFMEYTHEHLDKIICQASSTDSTNDYKIPDNLIANKELILNQIKILNDLFPKMSPPPDAKRSKMNENATVNESATSVVSETKPKENIVTSTVEKVKDESPKAFSMMSTSVDGCSSSCERQQGSSPPQNPKPKINISDYNPVVAPKGKTAQKIAANPYNYFLTVITSSPATHREELSITFQELLDPSLGQISSSLQINFMVDLGWLLAQYYFAGELNKPLLILYGNETEELQTIPQKKPNIKTHLIKMPTPFSTHHSKIMLFHYTDDSMRIIVSTANLYEADWHNRTQGLWISDRLPMLPDGTDTGAGESTTQFRNELLKYLSSYKLADLQPWLVRIRKTDFSSIKVFLITSIPGTYHETINGYPHGHGRVAYLLSKFACEIEDSAPIVSQSSSIGSFGANISGWLSTDFINSFRRDNRPVGLRAIPNFRLIYPSLNNVMNSHDALIGGGCLPYSEDVHQKQQWLQEYLFQWQADCRFRTKAMPHIKTYCRWMDKKLYWFILTSANLSRAAWGSINKTAKVSPPIRINNYEAGVMFIPKFVTKTDYFSMDESDKITPVFPQLYDIPLKKYAIDDTPFLSDLLAGL